MQNAKHVETQMGLYIKKAVWFVAAAQPVSVINLC